jgi:hypothetical protein
MTGEVKEMPRFRNEKNVQLKSVVCASVKVKSLYRRKVLAQICNVLPPTVVSVPL